MSATGRAKVQVTTNASAVAAASPAQGEAASVQDPAADSRGHTQLVLVVVALRGDVREL